MKVILIILLNGIISLTLAALFFHGIVYHGWMFPSACKIFSVSGEGESAYDDIFVQLFCLFLIVTIAVELFWCICGKVFLLKRDSKNGR